MKHFIFSPKVIIGNQLLLVDWLILCPSSVDFLPRFNNTHKNCYPFDMDADEKTILGCSKKAAS